jgi:branched-chain amino acid transport system permease protein
MIETLGQQVVNALTIGSMYTLVGVGFTLFFGVLGLINFAHGDVYMLGAFAGLVMSYMIVPAGVKGIPYILFVLVFAMVICACIGAVIERFAYKPIRGKPKLIMLITSLAVSILIREGVKEFFPAGANPHPFFSPFENSQLVIGGLKIGYNQIMLIVISLVLIIGLYLVVAKTWIGRSMRAIAEDQEAARMMGVDVNGVIRNAFLLGSARRCRGGHERAKLLFH